LRTLDLSHLPVFRLVHESAKILIRDEFIILYKELISIFESRRRGVVVTGQPGIGEKPIYF
jgi:hypothetical protein